MINELIVESWENTVIDEDQNIEPWRILSFVSGDDHVDFGHRYGQA